MDNLTDDMQAMLRAAHRVGSDGEVFILEELHLPSMSDVARKDCTFILSRDPLHYLDRRTETRAAPGGDSIEIPDPRGTPYALSKLGRPQAKQLSVDHAKAAAARRWKIFHRLVTAVLAVALPVTIAWLNRRLERIEKQQPAATQPLK